MSKDGQTDGYPSASAVNNALFTFQFNFMFDQILAAVKEHLGNDPQVANHIANLTPEQQDALHQTVANHIQESMAIQAASPAGAAGSAGTTTPTAAPASGGSTAGGILSSIEKSVASGGMATSAVAGGLVGALSGKLGLPSAVSGAIAAAVPGLMQKLANRNQTV